MELEDERSGCRLDDGLQIPRVLLRRGLQRHQKKKEKRDKPHADILDQEMRRGRKTAMRLSQPPGKSATVVDIFDNRAKRFACSSGGLLGPKAFDGLRLGEDSGRNQGEGS
jgi:hypothetical protein